MGQQSHDLLQGTRSQHVMGHLALLKCPENHHAQQKATWGIQGLGYECNDSLSPFNLSLLHAWSLPLT